MRLSIFCASTGNHEKAVDTWVANMAREWPVMNVWPITVDATIEGEGAGYLTKIDKGWRACQSEVIAYFHNDLFIHTQGWDEMVLAEFEDPNVVIVSFCGAMGHGRSDIYQTPYDFRQLGRSDFISNMDNAEAHGRRVLKPCDVAVVDTFSCIVRKSFLDEIGGWKKSGLLESHCSDYWICLMAHRYKARVRYLPVECTHLSGGVRGDGSFDYAAWQKWYGHTDSEMHQVNHRKIYDEFGDILPIRIR